VAYKPRIKLVVVTSDGHSTCEVKDPHVTPTMITAARELIYAISTGKLHPRSKTKKTRPTGRPEDAVRCPACGYAPGDSCDAPRSHPSRVVAHARAEASTPLRSRRRKAVQT
jgi:hypothetical protein